MNDTVHILGISGSLRKDSYNTAALRAAQELAPAGMKIEIADISQLPLYHADVQAQGFPEVVQKLGAQIRTADGLLFACPEYNYSVSGVLKNAIDWVSRLDKQPFAGKHAAIMGASIGMLGTARAQYHLRQIGVFVDLRFLNRPEVMIAKAQDRFDSVGKLTDAPTRELIAKLLIALRDSISARK
ncbi:MAG: NADPH-dependent FMN reductase [Stenotrophobium sp.]